MSVYRILYVAGFDTNYEGIASAFEELGHVVLRMEESTSTAQEVVEMSRHADLLLCEEGRLAGDHRSDKQGRNYIYGYWQDVLNEIEIPCVSWLTNIFMSVGPRTVEVSTNPIFKADIVFSTDGGHQKEFEAAGVNHVLLRQGIHAPEAHFGNPTYPTKAEIGFIGSIYENIHPYRKTLVDWCKATYGDRFEHFGNDGKIRHEPLNDLCATLKVVVGDSVRSPYYWSNRVPELIGRGAFLIHPWVEGLDEFVTPYVHYLPYPHNDFGALKEIIDYFSDDRHKDERDKIRAAGMKHIRDNHTYLHKVRDMLKVLKERNII